MNKKVAFKTLGCKVNTYEAEAIYEEFKKDNYVKVSPDEVADVYVINTCSVTNTGDKKSRQAIRKCVKTNPEAVIVVMGCYSQLKPKDVQNIEGVDIILGTQGREKLLELVKKYQKEKQPIVSVFDIMKTKNFENISTVQFESKTRAFLKIQEGCNNFCTFCIIPWARGLIRSQDPEKIIDQVNSLVKQGIKEVVLTGIHTGGYGMDLEDYSFADLLADLEKIEDLKRIRISSIEINQLDENFINVFKKSNKIVEHLHIPIQAGSDQILKKMKRNYTLEEFKNKINYIKSIFPNISITTDVIVGFPQEDGKLFELTKNTIKEIEFSSLHIFPYSKRNGTIAANMDGQVDEIEKKRRVKELLNLSIENAYKYNQKFQNKVLEVLIETKTKDGYYIGYSPNYIQVKIKQPLQLGEIYNVTIKTITKEEVIGEVI